MTDGRTAAYLEDLSMPINNANFIYIVIHVTHLLPEDDPPQPSSLGCCVTWQCLE